MHRGKIFNLIFLSLTVVNLGSFSIFLSQNFFQLYFLKSYSGKPTVGLRKIRLEIFPLCISFAPHSYLRLETSSQFYSFIDYTYSQRFRLIVSRVNRSQSPPLTPSPGCWRQATKVVSSSTRIVSRKSSVDEQHLASENQHI